MAKRFCLSLSYGFSRPLDPDHAAPPGAEASTSGVLTPRPIPIPARSNSDSDSDYVLSQSRSPNAQNVNSEHLSSVSQSVSSDSLSVSSDSGSVDSENKNSQISNSKSCGRSMSPNPALYREESSDSEGETSTLGESTIPELAEHSDDLFPFVTRPLYPNAKGGLTGGEFFIRLLSKAIRENTSRSVVREDVRFNASIFNDINSSTDFPTSLQVLWRQFGYEEFAGERYEVCSLQLANGEYCNTQFPPLNQEDKIQHIHEEHTCSLCVCQTVRDGEICGTRRFESSSSGEGRVKPLAGGIYIGLAPGFRLLQQNTEYQNNRSAFLTHRASVSSGSGSSSTERGMRWHDSPNGKAMEAKYCKTLSERKSITFWATFWDYLDLAGKTTTYSIGMKLVHCVDLLMIHVGKAQFIFLSQITFGPKKSGHYDAHNEHFYRELRELEVQGLDGDETNKLVLVKVYADRPAMEGELGLCGHNNAKGCGFCTGGQSYFGGATRYVGYDGASESKVCSDWGAKQPQEVVLFNTREWMQHGIRADEGDADSPLKRASFLFHGAASHMDPLVNAVLPLAHALGHGVCGNYIDIVWCKQTAKPAFMKLGRNGKSVARLILLSCEIPNDASRACDFHTTRRGYMTFVEEVEALAFILPLVLPMVYEALSPEDQQKCKWYLVALEQLLHSVRWYFFGVTPAINPINKLPLVTFEDKVNFAHNMSMRYARVIERCAVVKCLTYNLHAMVYHFPHQEKNGGAMCCDNELFGERFLKVGSKLGEGLVQTPCVELTIAHKVSQTRVLADAEGKLRKCGLLLRSYTGHNVAGKDEPPVLFNRIKTVDVRTHHNLLMLLQEFGDGEEEEAIPLVYASANVNGLQFNGVFYPREHARSSYWVSYNKEDTVAYGCVQFFLQVGGQEVAVMNKLELLAVDKYMALELRNPTTPELVIVPVKQLRFKLIVYKKPGTSFLRAAEWLHLRVEG